MLIFRSPLSTSTPPSPVTASSAWCFCHSDSSQNVQNNQPLFPRSGPHLSLRNKIHAQPSPGLKVEHTLCLFWLKSQTKCKLFSNSFLNDFQIFCSYFYYLFWLIWITFFDSLFLFSYSEPMLDLLLVMWLHLQHYLTSNMFSGQRSASVVSP